MRERFVRAFCVAGSLLALSIPARAAGPGLPSFASGDFGRVAKAVPMDGALRLENVEVAETGEAAAFDLERFQVFASDAEITIHGEGGETTRQPAPANAYFRGKGRGSRARPCSSPFTRTAPPRGSSAGRATPTSSAATTSR